MSTLDIFYSVVVISFIMGIFGLAFSYTDVTVVTAVSNLFNQTYAQTGYQEMPALQQMSSFFYQFSFIFPDMAALSAIILIASSWMLSFFIKAHPLAAIGAIAMLVVYTIASFYVSNVAVQVARLPVFSAIVTNAGASGLLLLLWINMPVILVIASVIDIAIAFTAARG